MSRDGMQGRECTRHAPFDGVLDALAFLEDGDYASDPAAARQRALDRVVANLCADDEVRLLVEARARRRA